MVVGFKWFHLSVDDYVKLSRSSREEVAVSLSPRPWMDVFALPRPQGPKNYLFNDCATAEMLLNLKNLFLT